MENAEERELGQHLHDIEQERDQVVAHDPGWAMELEEEVWRLTQVIDEMQGRNRASNWRIMLDSKSPLSAEIMSVVISKDFHFPNLKYARRTNPLVHIEHFNDIMGLQGLSQAQRCRLFPLALEVSSTISCLEKASGYSSRCAKSLQNNFEVQ